MYIFKFKAADKAKFHLVGKKFIFFGIKKGHAYSELNWSDILPIYFCRYKRRPELSPFVFVDKGRPNNEN